MRAPFHFFLGWMMSVWGSACIAALVPMDTGQGIFFPRDLGQRVQAYSAFPLTWWSFLTYDLKNDSDFEYVRDVCLALRAGSPDLVRGAECSEDLSQYESILRDWARDIALRIPKPADSMLDAGLRASLGKAALPLDRSLLGVLRFDPMGTYRELRERLERKSPLKLKRREGLFFDADARRIIIPIRFAFPAAEAGKTQLFMKRLSLLCGDAGKCDRWGFIGVHASTFENQHQVREDVAAVSRVGAVLLLALLGAVALLGRWQLLLMVPVVLVAVVLSSLLTVLIFGSIHGLTLSMGTGIVGLALDYGLHRALNPQAYVWRSNLFGLLTTVGVLLVLMFSTIPLLRQMMVFSALGISCAFLILYLVHRYLHLFSNVRAMNINPQPSKLGKGLTLLLVIGLFVGAFCFRPVFDLARFNFQTAKNKALTEWFFHQAPIQPPLFRVHAEPSFPDRFTQMESENVWADTHGVSSENIGRYLPPPDAQRGNLITWVGNSVTNDASCQLEKRPIDELFARLGGTERAFFEPFISAFGCESLHVRGLDDVSLPTYARDLAANGSWLTLFFPRSPDDVMRVKEAFPEALSLKELVSFFPETLGKELKWMAPVSFVLVWLILFIYYRRVSLTFIAYIPFFTALGLTSWVFLGLGLEVSFISLVGIVMLYGLSVDYGIFATDAARMPPNPGTTGAWTAILFAAAVTFSGFVPLLYCKHHVLSALGQVLTCGTIGTVLGAFWGVPNAMEWLRRRGGVS